MTDGEQSCFNRTPNNNIFLYRHIDYEVKNLKRIYFLFFKGADNEAYKKKC